jgi:hypothetical protein
MQCVWCAGNVLSTASKERTRCYSCKMVVCRACIDRSFDKDVVDVMCDWVHMLEPIRAEDSDEPPNRMFHKWRRPACNPRQIECKGGLWG